jgi:hypothetical protein
MFIDANTLEDGFRAEADVCIVGAGAAGITLAVALAATGTDVVLLESGGLVPDAPTQALSDTIDRDPRFPFTSTRLRYFGGSTNHWGGLCRALDEDDFLVRPWIGESGWPFRRAELVPYYERALPMLEIPRAFSLDDLDRARPDRPYLVARDHPGFTPLVWLQSPPTMMGERYRDAIAEDPHVRCLLHANAVEISMDAGGRHATGIRMATLGGRRASIAAKRYVLCAGAIENARLLLLSDSVVPGGIGNGHDLVGRCFMTHFGVGGTLALVASEDGGTFREEALIQHRPGLSEHVFGWTTNAALRARLGLLGWRSTRSWRTARGPASGRGRMCSQSSASRRRTARAVSRCRTSVMRWGSGAPWWTCASVQTTCGASAAASRPSRPFSRAAASGESASSTKTSSNPASRPTTTWAPHAWRPTRGAE